MKITIAEVSQFVGQEVTIGAWLANKRSSGKIAFCSFVMELVSFKGLPLKAK